MSSPYTKRPAGHFGPPGPGRRETRAGKTSPLGGDPRRPALTLAAGGTAWAISAQSATAGDPESPPTRVRLLPDGDFRAVDGRPTDVAKWTLTAWGAAGIVAAASARQSDFVIDYEHQSLRAASNGQPAPAAGWYRALEYVPGEGIFAVDVRWTPAAARAILAGEYRYVSPVFGYDSDGAVRTLVCAALVANPGLDGLTDLAPGLQRLAAELAGLPAPSLSANPAPLGALRGKPMDELFERLRYLLNLPLTATADDIVGHLEKLIGMIQAAGGPDGATADAALAAVLEGGRMKIAELAQQLAAPPDPAKYVAASELAAARQEIDALKTAALQASVDRLIETGIADGRLLPAQAGWARELGLLSVELLAQHLETAPPIDALRGTQTGGSPPDGLQGTLDKDDPMALARAALAYQTEQATRGVEVSIIQAVKRVAAPQPSTA